MGIEWLVAFGRWQDGVCARRYRVSAVGVMKVQGGELCVIHMLAERSVQTHEVMSHATSTSAQE
eukprot:12231449-Alexandrium_andersonii.AAC.1